MQHPVSFIHNGKHYEIRLKLDGDTTHVRAFLDGKPANGFEYSVDLPMTIELRQGAGLTAIHPAVQHLIGFAKNDIASGAWEQIEDFFRRE